MTHRNYRAAVMTAAALAALATLTGASQCDPSANPGKPGTGSQCDEKCSTQPDTVTLTVCWDSPTAPVAVVNVKDFTCTIVGSWPDGAIGTVDWSKNGVRQAHVTHPLTAQFHKWEGWEHDWAKQGYPEITLTADTSVDGYGVRCFMLYQPKGGGLPVVLDFEQRGAKDGTGQVHCSSATWFKLPGNAGKKPGQ